MIEAYEEGIKALEKIVMGLTARALLADAVADKLNQTGGFCQSIYTEKA